MTSSTTVGSFDVPYFEDLTSGWRQTCPGTTVSESYAGVYQAIIGDQTRLHRDAVYTRSLGLDGTVLNPALVAHVSIGHSTLATRAVVANLYYEDLVFHRPVVAGTTLTTTVEVLAAAEATPRPDRPPRGKVLLGVETRDERGDVVVSYSRCALVRKRADVDTGRRDSLAPAGKASGLDDFAAGCRWFSGGVAASHQPWPVGELRREPLREPVTDALALVRLTGNGAQAHRDPHHGQVGKRLVYGGHTISLAQAALARLLPDLVTVVGWRRCEHPATVFEGDMLETTATPVELLEVDGWDLVLLEVSAHVVTDRDQPREVLRWQPVVAAASGAVHVARV